MGLNSQFAKHKITEKILKIKQRSDLATFYIHNKQHQNYVKQCMNLTTEKLNQMAMQDHPQLRANSFAIGTDPKLLKELKQEKCHETTKVKKVNSVASNVIEKLQENCKRLHPILDGLQNYCLD